MQGAGRRSGSRTAGSSRWSGGRTRRAGRGSRSLRPTGQVELGVILTWRLPGKRGTAGRGADEARRPRCVSLPRRARQRGRWAGAARTARRATSCALRARPQRKAAGKREPVWTSVRGVAVKAVQPCKAGAEHTRPESRICQFLALGNTRRRVPGRAVSHVPSSALGGLLFALPQPIGTQGLSRAVLNFASGSSLSLYEVVHVTPRQPPSNRAGPVRPTRRPSAVDRGSPGPAGSASPPPPARSPPSVESSGRRATA